MAEIATGVARSFGAEVEFSYRRGYPVTENAEEPARIAAEAAVVGADNVVRGAPPTMGAEDFSFMLDERPGCYIWLGQAGGPSQAMVHNPTYDFNDEVLPIGASWFAALIESQMPR